MACAACRSVGRSLSLEHETLGKANLLLVHILPRRIRAMPSNLEAKIDALSKRLEKLELAVFGGSTTQHLAERTASSIERLKIPPSFTQ